MRALSEKEVPVVVENLITAGSEFLVPPPRSISPPLSLPPPLILIPASLSPLIPANVFPALLPVVS